MNQLTVITDNSKVADEHFILNEMFRLGLTNLHLRKSILSIYDTELWLEEIEEDFRNRITVIHQYFPLVKKYGIQKIHFTEKDRLSIENKEYLASLKESGIAQISTSIHAADDYDKLEKAFDYTFIGPIYNSISKQGYTTMPASDLDVLNRKKSTKIIALGGINKDNCKATITQGFDGVAVLGAVWQHPSPLNAFLEIKNELQ